MVPRSLTRASRQDNQTDTMNGATVAEKSQSIRESDVMVDLD